MQELKSFMPSVICLDVDGVLSNFILGVAELFNVSYDDLLTYANWDIFNKIGVSELVFWNTIDMKGARFWAELKKFWWTDVVYNLCTKWCPNVYLVTSPGFSVSAAEGKMNWFMRYFPEQVKTKRYFIGDHKALLAQPDRLLIDDNGGNCKKFEAAGGKSLLFPQPWNDSKETPESIIEFLKSVVGDPN